MQQLIVFIVMDYISQPKVSVLIRTRDIEKHFVTLLKELSCQTIKPSEIVVVNNFSSKKELKRMNYALSCAKEKYFDNPIKLIHISDRDFSHSYSTNIGVNAANSELVCITNGHSLPTSIFWLASGIRHFKNPDIAGVSGYFFSHVNGSIWERICYNLLWPTVLKVSKASTKTEYFSTINCIIRKSLWKEYPFDENLLLVFPETKEYGGEDYDWAKEMVARGFKVLVDPKLNVYHSHDHMLPEIITRNLTWYRIRNEIDLLKRPRKSYTRLNSSARALCAFKL